MRSLFALSFLASLLGLNAIASLRADDKKTPPQSIEDLIRDLSHPVFTTRERATEQLRKRGR